MGLYAVTTGQLASPANVFITNTGGLDVYPESPPPGNLIDWLNRILIEEARRVMRFKSHYFLTLGHPQKIASIFLIHSNEKLLHIHTIARRIVQLGGVPAFSVENLFVHSYPRVAINYVFSKLIEENLHAERDAVNSYRNLIHYLSDSDLTTSRILTIILKADEKRVEELVDWLGENVKKLGVIQNNKNIFRRDIQPVL
ncbi:MAG: hypothetical protein B0W54_20780 [Cellvibrio sp. 79]|nr:MAG: hypothetical protein B0W54_20780 [Cellvibrio sp. 79]